MRLCWTALKIDRCKKMRIYNTALKLARFIHIMLRKNVLNSRQFLEYFGILTAAWSYRALQKNFTSIFQEKLKVNQQTKIRNFFEFLSLRYKSEITPKVSKLTPRISSFWKLSSRWIGLCNFYFAKFLMIWEINYSNGRVYIADLIP